RMATLGAAAGGGVVAGLLLSALLHRAGVGIPAILYAFSVLTLLAAPLAWRAVPPGRPSQEAEPLGPRRRGVALLLAAGAFAVNFSLTGLLLFSPPLVAAAAPGLAYEVALLLMLLPAGLGMFAAARLADRGRAALVGVVAAALLGAAPLAFLRPTGAVVVVLAGVLFFLGHSSLASLLPALAARLAPSGRRGFAQGLQSTFQHLGSAAGATVVGLLWAVGAGGVLALAFLASGALVAGVVVATAR
ncbi:MAG TPA: MFS transporter, partial [Candidatus Thermoplasmatota archaeon]|nr:MFS transporter [Candidatus Thermoplasmatota archaeon]